MQTAHSVQAPSRQTTTKLIHSRIADGMQRPHASSSSSFAAGHNHQAQPQRPHAVLQRCHSLLVRQSASGSGAATQQTQQVVTQQQPDADLQQQLQVQQQQQQQQEWQQEQLQQQLPPQLLPFQEEGGSQPGTSYSRSSSSRGLDSNGASAAAGYAGAETSTAGSAGGAAAAAAAVAAALAAAEPSTSGRPWQALDPPLITCSIRSARSIAELNAVVSAHAPVLNCIHIGAAFVQLQRLWPQPSTVADPATSSTSSGASRSSSSSSSGLPVARQLLLRLQSLALSVPRIDSRFVANVLHSLAVLQAGHGEPGAYNAALVDRLCAAASSLANSMPPQELATLAWSLARLGVVPAPALLRRLASNVLRQLPGFKPQDLLMVLNSLPALHQTQGVVAPYATVHKLAAAAGQVLPAASAHEAAALLAALGALQWRAPQAWLQAYWAAAAPKLAGSGWEQLGMTGWALGQLAPLSCPPSPGWVEAWEGALTQQLLLAAPAAGAAAGAPPSSSSSSSGGSGTQQVPVVELVMALYGWSKAMPQQPPSEQLQQLVLKATQAALAGSSGSSSGLSIKQQRQQHQRRLQEQQQQHWGLSAQPGQPQQQQQQEQAAASSTHSSSSGARGLNPRLLGELVSAMGRWQLLPPRPWLLLHLSAAQQQLLAGQYSTRDLSSTLWGLARLGVRPSNPWLDLAAAAAEQQMAAQAQAVLRLQRQQRAWQQQQTREWAGQRGSKKASVVLASSPAAATAVAQEGSPQQYHSSVLEQLGSDSQRQLQQYSAVPKQLAVLLWSLGQLRYRPGAGFWEAFWALSGPLLPRQYSVRDLAMTLEEVLQQQQAPPEAWVAAALKAGRSAHMRQQQQAPAGGFVQQQQAQDSRSSSPSSSQQPSPPQQQQQQQQQQRFLRDVLRMLGAFGRLRVQPGHSWCSAVLEGAVRPHAGALSAEDTCQLLWALGACGYSPPGRALPAWLQAHLTACITPAAPAALADSGSSSNGSSRDSSSSGNGTSSGGSSSSSSGDDAPGRLFDGLGVVPTLQLLYGLRRSRVVVAGPWLAALWQASEAAAAAELDSQVLVQLLLYVTSTGLAPPASWTASMTAALPTLLQQQPRRQQQQQQLDAALSCLCRLRAQLQPQQVLLLQQAAARVLQGGDAPAAAETSERVHKLLAALEHGSVQQQPS